MAHLDSSTLATYNSLVDPHLQCYFSNERIRSHLKHAGLIGRRGDVISDSEYRSKLARRDHKKHVRQMLAENIVHRAIDMERSRQAELRRQFDVVAKAALVNSVKESRRRGGYSSGNTASPNDMGLLSMHSSWSQARPKSASQPQENDDSNDQTRIPRVQSAHVHNDHRLKYSSKSPNRRQRYLNRPKSTSVHRSSPLQRSRSPTKPIDSSPPCQIRMVYFGPHTKIDYDHSLFEPVDEIMVMQQHCGGENLVVYKANLKAGEEFTFNSRRHAEYPLGLSLYVKGLIDSRISTCCEYKHRHGVRLGGERGHFAIISVDGSKPCIKCRFEKQARLKQYADSPRETDETEKGKTNPITISLPVSAKPKNKAPPVEIPVRRISKTSESYSEDFEGSDRPSRQKVIDSTSSSQKPSPKPRAWQAADKPSSETSSRSAATFSEDSATKTWQITFHTSNLSSASFELPRGTSAQALLKFSFLSAKGEEETEQCEIKMNDFVHYFKAGQHDSFPAKLKNIGQPKQIRLTLELTNNNDDDEIIQWHLDHVEVIDPETQAHSRFPCQQWIRPFEEKLLSLSEESPKALVRRSFSSTSSSTSVDHSKPLKQKPKVPSRSPSISSTDQVPTRFELISKPAPRPTRRISTDKESNDGKNPTHYRVIIYPSKDNDGEFSAGEDSRIFLRLNNQTKDSSLYERGTKQCPSFQSGENQTFEMDLVQEANEKPTKLTIGFHNTDVTAGKWKLDKIVLIDTETNEHTTFPCRESLTRNDLDLRAEKTFHAQSQQSDDEESTPRNKTEMKEVPTPKEEKEIPSKPMDRSQSTTPDSVQPTTTKKIITVQSPSVRSHESSDAEDNEYNLMFKRNAPVDASSRPKTRRGLQDSSDEQENTSEEPSPTLDIWRPSSELSKTGPVDPLVGLDDLQDQTARSSEQKTQNTQPSSTTVNRTEDQFQDWYSKNSDNDDEEN